MAVAGVKLDLNTDELKNLRLALQRFFPAKQAATVLAPIVRKAIQPTLRRLREITPVGPTGNLKRAAGSKVVTYKQSGVVVGIVGYTRAGTGKSSSAAGGSVQQGKDRAFHQWWIERGTKERKGFKPKRRVYARRSPTKPFARNRNGQWELVMGKGVIHVVEEQSETYIASSFNKLGPFKIQRTIGMDGDSYLKTNPGYPKAFFKKSKKPISITGVAPGGVDGRPPLSTAWTETQSEVAAIMSTGIGLAIEQAWAALRFRDSGTLNNTDTL